MSGIFTSFRISASGMSAQRQRMDAVSSNIANAETTRGPDGTFYKRRRVFFDEDPSVRVFNEELRQASIRMAQTNPRHLGQKKIKSDKGADLSKVQTSEQRDPETKFKLVYDPGHRDADENGYVKLPDINIMGEMVDMMVASRAYEANIVSIEASKNMAKKALDI
ncbi:MAG: flagellar basal body rod protein FlgC [candidate division Zixibacteria bacterium]|nr:flagellar basal body rod protein FlgC [candidate division Zixibacteria bacterium]